ncbi:MAG: hypothetical protein AXA67_01160 [Methylothermaceae bacteria B42]|nr:MAG: hypothetical protein AXA67_01160 [Methylothermaceae bacteria B42]HHJ40487.1 TraB/GumN family protein [Methylothermaceae bacterium]
MTARYIFTLLTVFLLVQPLNAAIFRCKDPDGRVSYQYKACESKVGAVLQTSNKNASRRFFWRAVKQDKILYLLGSIHFGKADLYPLPDPIMQAYRKADAVVVEVDIRNAPMQSALSMAQTLTANNSQHQNPPLPPQIETALQGFAKKAGIPFEILKGQNPWLISMLLTQKFLQQAGYRPELGIDRHFLQLASQDNKPVIPLETLASQQVLLRQIATLPRELLFQQLMDQFQYNGDFQQLMEAWQTGDTDLMDRLTRKAFPDPAMEPLYQAVFARRNHNMTNKLLQLEDGKTYFVTVGAAHMVGKEGIIKLLEKHGFQISQPSF